MFGKNAVLSNQFHYSHFSIAVTNKSELKKGGK